MAKFTEINYQGNLKGTDYMWGVHVAGCADIEREVSRHFGIAKGRALEVAIEAGYVTDSHEASTMRELLDSIVDGESRELGWGDEHVKVHNCVGKALKGTGTAATVRTKGATTMSAAGTKIASKSVASVKTPSTKATKKETANVTTKTTTKTAAVKSTRNTVDDAQLAKLCKGLMGKGTEIQTKSGLLKAVRAKGISVKGQRVRDLFTQMHKATKSQKSQSK